MEDTFNITNKKVRIEFENLFNEGKLLEICNIISDNLKKLNIEDFGDYELSFVAKKIKNDEKVVDLLAVISSSKRIDGSYSGVGFGVVPPRSN